MSDGIRDHVTSFTFTVLATVRATAAGDERRQEQVYPAHVHECQLQGMAAQ